MKLKLVSWIREAHGKSGDTVFREVNGETIVADKPGKRKGAVAAEVTAAWEECLSEGYNLQALLTGGDPTKSPF